MTLVDCLSVVCISIMSTLVAEGISWALIYRTEAYKVLKDKMEKTQEKIDRRKTQQQAQAGKLSASQQAKLARLDDELAALKKSIASKKFGSTFVVFIVMISLFGAVRASYDGIVVAKLPFEPVPLIRGITHRNLIGSDYTHCAMAFFYFLCSLGLRPTIQKLLGTQPPSDPNSPGFFDMPAEEEEEE